jgi:outer membrane protein OmpA-like peptidoglycan-associated protein
MKKSSCLGAAGVVLTSLLTLTAPVMAENGYSRDDGWLVNHPEPRWRETEAHPFRVAAYVFHPIGWVAREVVFRPLSFFASSSETSQKVMGVREAGDWRSPSCYSKDVSTPDCRGMAPFNFEPRQDASSLQVAVEEFVFPNVLFESARADLNAEGRSRVKDISASLSANRSVRVVLEGHTDDVGSEESNQELGFKRALAVQAELSAQGVAADRLSAVSFGEGRPVDLGKTAEARALNRRVEVKVAR